MSMDSRVIYVCSNYEDYEFKSKRIWRTDGKYEPFVYIVQEVETEMMYIGSKTQYKRSSCLESWLGSTYFTSSKYVNWNVDEFKVIEIIPCASNHDALILEGLLISEHDAVNSDNYYNKHHPDVGWNTSGYTHTEEAKKKMSESKKGGKGNPKLSFLGNTHTKETKHKISSGNKGKKRTPEQRMNISNAHKGQIPWMTGRNHNEDSKKKMSEARLNATKMKCIHCNKDVDTANHKRWHGDNCKKNPHKKTKYYHCNVCGFKSENKGMISRWHNKNCSNIS